MLCFTTQFSFAQTDNFQGKLVYKVSMEGTSDDKNFNQAMIEKLKERAGNIDSVTVFIKDKYFRSETQGSEIVHWFQYVPSEQLVYEHLTKNDYIFIYSLDNELLTVNENDFVITNDSTISTINRLVCRSYTIDMNFGKTTYYYSDSLRSNSSILERKHTTNFLRTYEHREFIPVKTVMTTPFFIIKYELVNMELYDVPMTIFSYLK
ncbi:MAG: hypothetical protein ACJAUH_002364 [Saprospiraceae bacterium]|jgi:hypothetical protein